MLAINPQVKIYLHTEPIDMRKSFDGLFGIIKSDLHLDVRDGGVFMFLNLRLNRINLMYWDRDGIAIWMKRLESNCFQRPLRSSAHHHRTNRAAIDSRGHRLSEHQDAKTIRCTQPNSSRDQRRFMNALGDTAICCLTRRWRGCFSEWNLLKYVCQLTRAQIKDRHVLLTSVCFWGMIWPVATIDASAVREMNLWLPLDFG
ncbi:MAG: IS66 family insertion sequence element accessory protein TnpB, partial [Pirellulaceae bacterium]